jgi:regulator-associated protein of mTOR
MQARLSGSAFTERHIRRFLNEARHGAFDGWAEEEEEEESIVPWRLRDRMKTVSVALVMCLNIGVDPPDVIRMQPCAKMICWIGTLAPFPSLAPF